MENNRIEYTGTIRANPYKFFPVIVRQSGTKERYLGWKNGASITETVPVLEVSRVGDEYIKMAFDNLGKECIYTRDGSLENAEIIKIL